MGPSTDLSLHSRYYISRHTYGEDGLATETYYRTSTGSWSKFFSDAMLWSDKDFAVEKIKDQLRIHKRQMIMMKWGFVLGCVEVKVDPFFAMEAFRV